MEWRPLAVAVLLTFQENCTLSTVYLKVARHSYRGQRRADALHLQVGHYVPGSIIAFFSRFAASIGGMVTRSRGHGISGWLLRGLMSPDELKTLLSPHAYEIMRQAERITSAEEGKQVTLNSDL